MVETILFTIVLIVPTYLMLGFGLSDRDELNCGDNCKCFEEKYDDN